MARPILFPAVRWLSATIVALSMASTAFAQAQADLAQTQVELKGPGTTGGGNKCLLRIFDVNDLLAQGLREGRFKQLIELSSTDIPKQVANVKFKIGHDLIHDKEEVDAINDPDTQTITVDEKVCKEESNYFFRSVLNLLIHEHLGLARVDDEFYHHSRKMRPEVWNFIDKLFSSTDSGDSCYASTNLEKNKQLAALIAKKPYQNLIVNGATRNEVEKQMIEWLLQEMNFPSAMRDQVGDKLDSLANNGRNWYTNHFLNRRGEYCPFIRFTAGSVKVKLEKKLSGKRSLFMASFRATDGYRGGQAVVRMNFVFEAEVKVVKGKFYEVKAMSYPMHMGTEEFDSSDEESMESR